MDGAKLLTGLEPGDRELLSLVGAGGKTTLLFELARRLEGTQILTTTTKMSADRANGHEVLVAPSDDALRSTLLRRGTALVFRVVDGQKAMGVIPEHVDRWFEERFATHVLVEADGARRRLCKAPGPLEPVIPSATTYVLVVMAAPALGKVIADVCHRPMRVAALARCSPGERLDPERAAAVLTSPRGGRKNIPGEARTALVLTQISPVVRPLADDLAERCREAFGKVLLM